MEGAEQDRMEQKPPKRYYRGRAHANPLAVMDFDHPVSPDQVNWKGLFELDDDGKEDVSVSLCDLGSGFGGLLVELSKTYPDNYAVGMEIRVKPTSYTKERIKLLRETNPGKFRNIGVVRTNAMLYLPNYFRKHQLSKIFICFPDPHFKKRKHDRRLISPSSLHEMSHVLAPSGIIYTITDVEDLHVWMVKHLDEHPHFTRLTGSELDDPAVDLIQKTDEAQNVKKKDGKTYIAVYRKNELDIS